MEKDILFEVDNSDRSEKNTKQHWLGPFGAVFTAILASACCAGPFILVALGVSGAWIGNLRALTPYKPLFMFLTVGFLATGFYKLYRKDASSCEPNSLCATPKARRRNEIMLWTASVLALFLMLLPHLIMLWVG